LKDLKGLLYILIYIKIRKLKRKLNMEIEKVPRRERRHFRKYINGEIVYSDVPFGHEEKHNYSSKTYQDNSEEEDNIKSLLDVGQKKKLIVHKDEKIQKVLRNISDIVAPDIDSIADAIYSQVSNDDNLNNFKKEEIQETIKSSKHYRASKDESGEIVETDNMKSLVEDVFNQLESEEIRNENKLAPKKETSKKKEEPSKKNVKEEKKTKKKEDSDIQDLLDDDSDSLDLEEDNEDDLGLKF